MNAERLAFKIDPRARRYGRNWRVKCVAHDDHSPSLDLTDANGTILMICRSGCRQIAVFSALRARGLWHAESPRHDPPPPIDWQFCDPKIPTPEANRQFDVDYRLAHLRGEMAEAAHEIIELYRRAKISLTAADLVRELHLAVEVGGIGNAGFDEETVSRAITRFSRDTINVE
jgi:hypothetical protein